MATNAVKTQGTIARIGQGDARSVVAGSDTFDVVGECMGIDGPSGSAEIIDATHFASAAKEKLMGLPDEGQVTLRLNFVPDDAGLLSLRTAREDQELRNFQVDFNTSDTPNRLSFTAYVLAMNYAGNPNSKWDVSVTLEISGLASWGNKS